MHIANVNMIVICNVIAQKAASHHQRIKIVKIVYDAAWKHSFLGIPNPTSLIFSPFNSLVDLQSNWKA
jgi:hypothetical protein